MISCKEYVVIKKQELKNKVDEYFTKYGLRPSLCVVQVGDNPASNSYIKGKGKDCEEVGIWFYHVKLKESISQDNLKEIIALYANDDEFDGIIVQLPLPSHLNVDEITNCIPAKKDVDGFRRDSSFYPCTPKGIIDWLDYNEYSLIGRDIVVIGRSNIVGKPLVNMLIDKGASVACCHSKTRYLSHYTAYADVVISAVGKPKIFDSSYFLDPDVVIDVGINRDENGKLCGDIDRESVEASNPLTYVTPVPGGVGLLTRLALLENVVEAYEIHTL